jgi:catechol 2,3-dioxygenase-like lactoylglutathione lyase family enzyme
MGIFLDHTIVEVKNLEESIKFYSDILGFTYRKGQSEAFEVMRINNDLSFDLIATDSVEAQHFAFCMDQATFDAIFERIKSSGITFGDSFKRTSSMTGPGQEPGTRGMADAVYFHDPSGHLLEIRHYSEDK